MSNQLKQISKMMSLVLRHKPQEIGLTLYEHGWANVQKLIDKMNASGMAISVDILNTVVENNDKKRFTFNEDKTLIRANQGHSIEVELNLRQAVAPDILYHGTADKFLESILKIGLQKQNRQHVHLSNTIETAKAVGSRHGRPIVLSVDAKKMQEAGFIFYLSENAVWLTETVPVLYISR
ncbi:MAG: RNA 2'-phosphotransferase [Ginsengibacter sp.]